MSKYYVRTNEGAYLKSHAEFTHYWTKKHDDAEQLSLMGAMKVMDHNKDKLKKGVELYIEEVETIHDVEDVKQWAYDSLFSPIEPIEPKETDEVNHPSHYNQYSFAVVDIIDEVAPTYPAEIIAEMANVIKYVLRAPHKGQLKKDLGKIIWYTQRAIENLEEK